MTITLFLTICLLAILFLAVAFGGGKPRQARDAAMRQRLYAGIWLVLGLSAVVLVNRYLYPANKAEVFGNSDFHVLAHRGYSFSDSLLLADAAHPENALWDDLAGHARLYSGTPARMELDSFFQPLFLESEGTFALANPVYEADISQGFALWRGDSLLLEMAIAPYPQGDSVQYAVTFGDGKAAVNSRFQSKMSQGYPLADILRRCEGWQAHDSLVQRLEGAWLLRKEQGNAGAPLLFFPSPALARLPGWQLRTAGAKGELPGNSPRTQVEIPGNKRFFTGLGMSKSPEMRLVGDRLEFDYSRKYRLDHQANNQLFLCSDLRDVAQNTMQGGFLFPVFAEENNRFHVNATLRYAHGTAREPLKISVVDQQAVGSAQQFPVNGGDEFLLATRHPSDGVAWVLQLVDLRAENPIGRAHLFGFLASFVLLVLLTTQLVGWARLSLVEMCLYILLFAFLQVRLLLQWRMGTFLPVDDASKAVYHFLQNARHFNLTALCTAMLFGLRWVLVRDVSHLGQQAQQARDKVAKLLQKVNFLPGLSRIAPLRWWRGKLQEGRLWEFVVAYFAAWLFMMVLANIVGQIGFLARLERFANIAAPVGFFFFVEHLLEKHRPASQVRYRGLHPFALVNTLLTILYLGVTDAGFGIIFILFTLIYQLYRTILRPQKEGRSAFTLAAVVPAVLLILAFASLLFGADRLILGIFSSTQLYFWIFFVPIALYLTFYFTDYALHQAGTTSRKSIWLGGMLGGVVLLSLLGSFFVQNAVNRFSYVKFRAAIHEKGADEIIQDERFDSGQVGQILRAAQNQWYINTYLRKPEAELGRELSYFNLRPHFDKGSSYTTQTTDLVVTRYIISEHGVGVVLLLILLLFALAAVYSLVVDMSATKRFVPFGMLLLLFMVALFIWLTATNRFVFFGQDFPLISLTSLFTLVFSMGLILAVMVAVPQEKSRRRESKTVAAVPMVVILLIGLGLQVLKSSGGEKEINFNPSLDKARAEFNELNGEFLTFQNKLTRSYAPDSLVLLFHQSRPDSIVSSHTYTQSIYNHFVHEEENKTNPEHLLYLVQRPVNRELRYHFAVNPAYYLVKPPRVHHKAWSGNLLAAAENRQGAFLVGQDAGGRRIPIGGDSVQLGIENRLAVAGSQLRTAVIPGTWTLHDRPVVVAWASESGDETRRFSMSNSDFGAAPQVQRQVDPAVRLRPGDVLHLVALEGGHRRFRFVEDYKAYLAKNIWLNGERRMFYPLGEKLLWAYYYAEGTKNARFDSPQRKEDLRVSIDFSLMQNLHDVADSHFRKHNWEQQRLGLVVLNGQGQIRALTDYKPKDAVDPNDIDQIHEKNREFHLRRNNHDERQTFGNINLLKLQNGAGSTIKPIMYAAVSSQYNLGWKNLRTVGIEAVLIPELQDENGKLRFYAGKKVDVSWKGIGSDDYLPKSGRDYLVQSKNLYHSLVMFLGSYDPEDFRGGKGDLPPMLKRVSGRPDSLEFPLLNLGSGSLAIRENRWPRTGSVEKSYFGSKRSLLAEGLSTNFSLPIDYLIDARKKDYRNIDPAGAEIFGDAGAGPRLYAYPEQAHFYQRDRAFDPKHPLWFINGLRQVTAGNDPVAVTPLKMAEMTGRLFSQNRKFEVTLSDSLATREHAPWAYDQDSWDPTAFQEFMQENLYGSLRSVLTAGTAYRLWTKIRQRRSGYYYYAKTGTISDASRRDQLPDKLLMLVISKGDMAKMSTDELKENKFYVLYFSGMELFTERSPDKFWNLFAEMVETVEKSYLFQSYMQ